MTKRIGNYRIIELLGKGAFGCVFKVIDSSTSKTYAIKSIKKTHLERADRLKSQFLLEIKALKKCDNPGIVKLFEVLKTKSKYHLVMECCEGGTLENFIKINGPSNVEIVRKILTQLADALIVLKNSNIMHRDLKPANILLTRPNIEQADLKIADFGFARFLNNNSFAESQLGTPLYMAPEVLLLEGYNFRADIWSLGTIIYEIVFGIPAFKAETPVDLKRLHKMPVHFPVEISPELQDIILRMLKYDFNERISAEEIKNHRFLNPFYAIQAIDDSFNDDYEILAEEENKNTGISEADLKVIDTFMQQANEYFIGENNYLSSLLGNFEETNNYDLAKAVSNYWREKNKEKVEQAIGIIQWFKLMKEDFGEFFNVYETLMNLYENSIRRDEELNNYIGSESTMWTANELINESKKFIEKNKEMHTVNCAFYLATISKFYDQSQEIKEYYGYISKIHRKLSK